MPVHKEIQKLILNGQEQGSAVKFSDLYEIVSEEYSEEISRLAGMEAEENKTFDQGAYFFDCVRTLKRAQIDRKINGLKTMATQEKDLEKRKEFMTEIQRLSTEKRKLV